MEVRIAWMVLEPLDEQKLFLLYFGCRDEQGWWIVNYMFSL